MRRYLTILLLIIGLSAKAATYYVATTGNNAAAGTVGAPWLTWQYGFTTIVAGDTLYIRGGTYASAGALVGSDYIAVSVNNHDGTAANPIVVMNYPGETPILDCATMSADAAHYGIVLINCSYWELKGLEVMNVPQHATGDWAQGMAILYSTNMTIEECVTHHNGGVGMGSAFACDDILFLNCDSYLNADPYTTGTSGAYGDADGFGVEESAVGSEVRLTGCRSWNNSDDGYDTWDSDGHVYITSCWSWHNGYREDQVTAGGDGNGFKLGRTDLADSTVFARTIVNCLAFLNRYSGYTTNKAKCLMYFYNSVAWDNTYVGFQLDGIDIAHVYRNLISFDNTYNFNIIKPTDAIIDHISYHNTWSPSGPVADATDFVSTDTTGVSSARQTDGSLPVLKFLRLTSTSDLIGVGINLSIATDGEGDPYKNPPSLGAYEFDGINYYVSSSDGSDSNTGLSEDQAWLTIAKVNSIALTPADSALLKRGDTFRGGWTQTENGTNSNWIYYGAYGTGAKPKILGSKDLSATGDWENHATNVWKTTATLGTLQDDISNMIFNNEEYAGYKKKSIDSLNAAHKFFYNRSDDLLYMYCTSNPASFYTHIEAAGNYDVAQGLLYWINSSYIKVENLDVRYSSAAGIETHTGNCITVENCEVSWIGGEWLNNTDASLTRLGNGISMVQTNDSITVHKNKVSQCFDAGISPQYWSASSMTNMWIYNNEITNCWYSYETWCGATSTLSNVNFFNNTCVDAGDCWSNSILQRPDTDGASHIMIHTLAGTVSTITIRNNILIGSEHFGYKINDNIAKATIDYNIIICDTVAYANETNKYTTLAAWVAAVSQDTHSLDDNPLFNSPIDFTLQATSPAIDAGTNTGIDDDFDGNVRPYNSVYDIGAYEYGSYEVTTGTGLATGTGNNLMVDKNGRIIIIQ